MNGIVEYWIGGNVEKACGRARIDGWVVVVGGWRTNRISRGLFA